MGNVQLPQDNWHSWISGDVYRKIKHSLFTKEAKPHPNRKSHDLICSEYLIYKLHWNSICVPTWTWFPWTESKVWHEFMLWHSDRKWTHNTVTNSSIRSRNLFWKKSYQQHLLNLYWKWTLETKQALAPSEAQSTLPNVSNDKKKCGMWKRMVTNSFLV